MGSSRTVSSDHDPPIELLATEQRRRVLQYLMGASTDQSSLDELVDYLVDNPAAGRAPDSKTIRIRLHHTDLPKLGDYGVIDYDPRTGNIQYLPHNRIEAIRECLDVD